MTIERYEEIESTHKYLKNNQQKYSNKLAIIANNEVLTLGQSAQLFFSILGLLLPLAVLIDLMLDKNRKENPKDKKTDWFYKNEQFDRKLDDRADKNNYRTM